MQIGQMAQEFCKVFNFWLFVNRNLPRNLAWPTSHNSAEFREQFRKFYPEMLLAKFGANRSNGPGGVLQKFSFLAIL